MAFFLSFLAGVVFFYLFNCFPFITGFTFLSASAFLILRKKYVLIFVVAVGILYAFLRFTPETDFPPIRGKEMLLSGTFISGASTTSTGRRVQTFYPDSASIAEIDASSESNPSRHPLLKVGIDSQRGGEEGLTVNIISDAEFEISGRYVILARVRKDMTRLSPGVINNNNKLYANLIEVRDYKKGKKTLRLMFESARARLDAYIEKNFSADSGALVSAITTGRRTHMSDELKDAFNSTGLAHILSISGTHFGLFSVFLFGIFRLLIKYLPYRILQRITLYVTPSQGAAVLCIPFMVAYLGLAGWSIPAVRSFIMISLFLSGLLINRKGFWLNSLLFAAFIIVLWNPEALFSLSFQLSFLAVLFIGFSVGYTGNRKGGEVSELESEKDGKSSKRFLASGLKILRTSILISLAASVGTAPLVAYHFHYFSVISPLANLFITPLIGFVLLPLSLISSFVFLLTGNYPFAPLIKIISDFIVYLVMNISSLSFADIKISAFPAIIVVFFYAGAVIYSSGKNKGEDNAPQPPPNVTSPLSAPPLSALRRIRRGEKLRRGWGSYGSTGGEGGIKLRGRLIYLKIPLVIMVIYLFLSAFWKKHDINITYLDVGQGDSSVIELPDSKTLVIDAGKSGREVAAYLKYRGKKTIDSVILSHPHPDHTGGVNYLLANFKVKELWDNGRLVYPEGFLNGSRHRSFERGDIIEGKGYKIYALHPYKEFYTLEGDEYNEENNSSLVLKIDGKEKSFLFAGDIEEEAEEDISHLGQWLKSDAIKIPHHGGKTSASACFLNAVSPQIAVISAGRDNAFGHPHEETLDMLGNTKIYRTDIDGAIKITEKDGGLVVKTYKDFQFEKTRNFKGELRNIKRLFEAW